MSSGSDAKHRGVKIMDTGWNWEIVFNVSGGWRATVREPEDKYPSGTMWGNSACEVIDQAHVWIRAVTEATERANRPQI